MHEEEVKEIFAIDDAANADCATSMSNEGVDAADVSEPIDYANGL